MPGALHGRRDDRLLLLWLAVGQSWPQASILRCRRHPGELRGDLGKFRQELACFPGEWVRVKRMFFRPWLGFFLA